MGEDVFQIASVVFFTGEPHQALLVNVDPEWVDRSDCNVDSQVPLVPVYQQRIVHVLLDEAGGLAGASGNLIERGDHLDSFALT